MHTLLILMGLYEYDIWLRNIWIEVYKLCELPNNNTSRPWLTGFQAAGTSERSRLC